MEAAIELPVVVATGGSPRRKTHSEGIAYKLPSNEVAMCLPVGRMGSDKRGWSGTTERGSERGPLEVERWNRSHGGAGNHSVSDTVRGATLAAASTVRAFVPTRPFCFLSAILDPRRPSRSELIPMPTKS